MRLRHRKRFCGRNFKSRFIRNAIFQTIWEWWEKTRKFEINPIDEEHGIIDIEYITEKCGNVFQKYDVNFCYLFGSYAKSKAKLTSDVDLLISANVKGLKFYGLVEEIREALHKKVDVLEINQLKDNLELTQEILKDGIKIYG